MKQKLLILSLALFTAIFQSCDSELMYKNDSFSIYKNRVKQGKFNAKVESATKIKTNYEAKNLTSSILEFKFSLNGKDNELPFGVNHTANVATQNGQTKIVEIKFGTKDTPQDYKHEILAKNSKLKIRLDLSPVLNSFKEKGYYEDINGEKIFEKDFSGVYMAGNIHPLNWDFENFGGNKSIQLTDKDRDGIYELELKLNTFNPDAYVAKQWQLKNDIRKYPQFHSEIPLLNAIYNMSLDELVMNIEKDGSFRTGAKWPGVWTRDISYSVILSLAMLEPEIAKTSLLKKVAKGRIIQDTGTGGAWPVSSDRMVWAIAAWEIYKVTGDRDWLKKVYPIISKSALDDLKTIYSQESGLVMGESSFLDWRKQTYPLWMQPADIQISECLGTNAAYYKVLDVLAKMSERLGESSDWELRAENLKKAINKFLYNSKTQSYSQYRYGRTFKSLSAKQENLGNSFLIMYDIANTKRANQILKNNSILDYGIPCIYPQIPNIAPYHNNGIWPFVQAFYTLAGAKQKNSSVVEWGYASMLRAGALFLTNKENMVAEDGDFAGTEINSDRQLWSVAGQLAMNFKILFGMNFKTDGIEFKPVIPKSFESTYELNNFNYRKSVLHIKVKGYGSEIESFLIDGVGQMENKIPANIVGSHIVEITLSNNEQKSPLYLSENKTSPETPIVVYNGNKLSWDKIQDASEYAIFLNGKLIKKTKNTSFEISDLNDKNEFQEIQIQAVNSENLVSFKSEPIQIGDFDSKVLQLENFNLKYEQTNKGYNGNAYVRLEKESKALKFTAQTAQAGEYFIQFRYANGSGPINTNNKCGIRSIFVNNEFAYSAVFPQRGTDEWSNWGYTAIEKLNLKKGKNIFEVKFKDYNENMNIETNSVLLDEVILTPIN